MTVGQPGRASARPTLPSPSRDTIIYQTIAAFNPSLQPEIGPDGLPRESPVIAYTEKVIEEEQLQLRKYTEENYSKICDVERELANLTMELKLTAGPKKQVWEAASKAVQEEEAMKQKLCEDLNHLVQESSNSQFS
ncbi:uncharacterized protein LOC123198057 [Mangifera indica]|uniref:uncharacterized protein LOC123198057 n=1 Tax=Mangifera indica TaxID=29780 RepID=UPI001CFA543B|nr:uncharacterized protein LOC123198057 [Mangifera indica]